MADGRAHVLVVPYSTTGHTNPLFQFAKNLASRGLIVTFVSLNFDHPKILQAKDSILRLGFDVRLESIPDEIPRDVAIDAAHINDFLFKHVHDHMRGSGLEELIQRLNANGDDVSSIIYDSFMPWVPRIARKFNIPHAFFWTQSASVFNIYYHFKHVFLPPRYPTGLGSFSQDLDNIADASWVLVNSFYELEPETIDYLQTFLPILPIGPSIPSAFLDRRCPEDTKVGANLWKDADCLEWLDSKAPSSVVYISFGSITSISPRQIHELAVGIERSQQNFVWVIRPPQGQRDVREVFPVGFVEESKGRGLIVQWCAQLEVLSHPSVAAFMSHCGWNSSLDGLSLGVPMLTFGMWTDQNTNAKCLSDVWKMGLRMRKGEDGIVGREEVERCIRLAVNSKEIAELKKNGLKWKELAKRAMMEGGSSDTNLNSFVQQIVAKAALA
eukprot:Gb_33846 [translate_table: standard]